MSEYPRSGLRVLAFASRLFNPRSGRRASREGPPPREEVERNLVFRGLIGLYDPPRPGISVHMLTGDHPGTARAIAARVGILPNPSMAAKDVADSMVMVAGQFDQLSGDEIDRLPVLPLVIARCAPQTKVRMVEALHRRKAFVAMVRTQNLTPSIPPHLTKLPRPATVSTTPLLSNVPTSASL